MSLCLSSAIDEWIIMVISGYITAYLVFKGLGVDIVSQSLFLVAPPLQTFSPLLYVQEVGTHFI